MSRMGVAATMRMKSDTCRLAPSGHASGHSLPGQWTIPSVTWEKPVLRLAAAKRLKQIHGVGADSDGAGFAALTQEVNLASVLQAFDVLPTQGAEFRNTTADEIAAFDHHPITLCNR